MTKNFVTEFEFVHKGKCIAPEVCPEVYVPICAIPKIGTCGEPKSFSNFCKLIKHNEANPEAGMMRIFLLL